MNLFLATQDSTTRQAKRFDRIVLRNTVK